MADAKATRTAPPVVDTQASFKRPAATLAQPAAAPPSSGNTGARVMKRPSIKCRLAATEAKRPASNQRGAKSGSTHTYEEHEAEAPAEAPSAVPPLAAAAQESSAGGAAAGQPARVEYHPLAEHRPRLMLMDDGAYMNTKGEACDEFGRLLRRRGAKGGWKTKRGRGGGFNKAVGRLRPLPRSRPMVGSLGRAARGILAVLAHPRVGNSRRLQHPRLGPRQRVMDKRRFLHHPRKRWALQHFRRGFAQSCPRLGALQRPRRRRAPRAQL